MVKKLFIASFILLYLGIGIVSTVHSYEFFQLANLSWMAIVLAVCFEIGQAATLFSIFNNADTISLGGKLKRSEKIIPWVLMVVLTLVQIFGNLYSSYRYLDINNGDNVPYFAIPVLSVIGIDISNKQTVQIIISYIMGAILPILALLLTAMVDSFIKRPVKTKDVIEKPVYDHTQVDTGNWQRTGIRKDFKDEPVVDEPVVETKTEEPVVDETPVDEPVETIVETPVVEETSDIEEPTQIHEPIIRTNGITINK